MNENDELNLFVIYTAKPGMREAFLNDVKSSGILQLILDEKGCGHFVRSKEIAEEYLKREREACMLTTKAAATG